MMYSSALRTLLASLPVLFLAGCANTALVEREDLSSIEAQLAQQHIELLQQYQTIESLAEAHTHHHTVTLSAQSETLKSLTTLLNRSTHQSYCPPTPVANSCPEDDGNDGQFATDREIIGEIEHIRLQPPGRIFEARIDTGATTSSLNAVDIETFERDGEEWVRFTVPGDGNGDSVEMEEPVVRSASIIQSSADNGESRPVIELQIDLGGVTQMTEFTLSDRTHLTYPVLVGRSLLRDLFVVDVSMSRTTSLTDEAEEDDE